MLKEALGISELLQLAGYASHKIKGICMRQCQVKLLTFYICLIQAKSFHFFDFNPTIYWPSGFPYTLFENAGLAES